METYTADFEFKTEDGVVRSMSIEYTAASPQSAVRDAVRFWHDRSKNLPDWFTKLFCIKVFPRIIGPIDEQGRLTTRVGMRLFEYKCDTAGSLSLDEYIEWRVTAMGRK